MSTNLSSSGPTGSKLAKIKNEMVMEEIQSLRLLVERLGVVIDSQGSHLAKLTSRVWDLEGCPEHPCGDDMKEQGDFFV
jgi:hypothetical protein